MFRTVAMLPAALALVALAAACASPPPTSNPVPSATVLPTATPAITPTRSPATPATSTPTPAPTATHAPTASPTQTAAPSPTPASSPYPPGSVIVTFRVADEEYRILVIDQKNIAIALKLLDGEEAPPIPNGRVVRGDPSVNVGWSWHIAPGSLEFADMTTEVCDGLPSFVEAGTISGDQFCPWSAKVVAVDPANP